LALRQAQAHRSINPRHFRVSDEVAEHLHVRLHVDSVLLAADKSAVPKQNVVALSNLKGNRSELQLLRGNEGMGTSTSCAIAE
jgi:hypothetical protein